MSKDQPIDDVLRALSSLSKEQLEQVSSKARFLISTGGVISVAAKPARKHEPTSDSELMLSVICDFLSSNGLEFASPAQLRRAHGYNAFKEKVAYISQYLERGAGSLSRVEKQALFRVGIELLYKNLVKMNVAVSTRTILGHIHRFPSILNQSFPGYAQMGAIKIIIQRKSTPESKTT